MKVVKQRHPRNAGNRRNVIVTAETYIDGKTHVFEVHGAAATCLLALVAAGPNGSYSVESPDHPSSLATHCPELHRRYGLDILTENDPPTDNLVGELIQGAITDDEWQTGVSLKRHTLFSAVRILDVDTGGQSSVQGTSPEFGDA